MITVTCLACGSMTVNPVIGDADAELLHHAQFWPDCEVDGHGIEEGPAACFSNVRGERVLFLDAKTVANSKTAVPGTLLTVGSASCTIATGDGALRIGMVRPQSGEATPMPQFCRQSGLTAGDRLSDSTLQEAAPGGDC